MLLLSQTIAQKQTVARCCDQALATGVLLGMSIAQARALFDQNQVRVEPFDPAREKSVLLALGAWAHRFSPIVALDEPDGLLIDIGGCEGVFGGEERLIDVLLQGLQKLGFTARIGIAPTFLVAKAFARVSRRVVARVSDGELRDALAPLSPLALGVELKVVDQLRRVEIRTIGQLASLPRSTIPSRFGMDVLQRLDRALGAAPETVTPLRSSEPTRVERVFQGPTTRLDAIELAAQGLVQELSTMLRARESGARKVVLTLDRSDLAPTQVELTLSRASRDARHWWRLLRPRLDRVHLGYGVERLEMAAHGVAIIRHVQRSHWLDSEQAQSDVLDEAGGALIDTLKNRLGEQHVVCPVPRESHVPERAWAAALSPPQKHSAAWDDIDRPGVLFDPPVPAMVVALMPDGPPASVAWEGRARRIVASVGPERIGAEWWLSERGTRDYFRVQDESGVWCWVYHSSASGKWFVHGVWA